MSTAQKLLSGRSIGLLAVVLAGVQACTPIDDPDFYWRLKTGQVIARTHSVPRVDPFALAPAHGPRAGRPAEWVNTDWLWDLALHQVYEAGGPVALSCVNVALAAVLTLLVLRTAAPGGTPWWAALVVAAALAPMSMRFQMRPELTSMVLLALLLLLVERFWRRERDRWIWAVPAVLLLWANVHSLFVLGLAVLGLWTAGAWLHAILRPCEDKRAGLRRAWVVTGVLVLSTAACCLTPFGARVLTFPFTDLLPKIALDFYGELVEEFWSPWLRLVRHGDTSVITPTRWVLAGLVAAAGVSFVVNAAGLKLGRLFVFVGFACLGFMADRNGAVAAMVAAVCLSGNVSERCARARPNGDATVTHAGWVVRAAALAALATAVPLCALGLLPTGRLYYLPLGVGMRWDVFGNETARFLRETGMPGNVFTIDWRQAAVLIWENGPERKVFVDGRLEVHDAQRLVLQRKAHQALLRDQPDGPNGWRSVFDAYGVTHVVVSLHQKDDAVVPLAMSRHWTLVRLDGVCAVFARATPEMAAYIREHRLDLARAEVRPGDPSDLAARAPASGTGWLRLDRADSSTPLMILGYQCHQLGRPLLAVRCIRRSLVDCPHSALGRYFLALAYAALTEQERQAVAGAGRRVQASVAFRLPEIAYAVERGLACPGLDAGMRVRLHALAMWAYLKGGVSDVALEHARQVLKLAGAPTGDAGSDAASPPGRPSLEELPVDAALSPSQATDDGDSPVALARSLVGRLGARVSRAGAGARRLRELGVDPAAVATGLADEPAGCVGLAIRTMEQEFVRRTPGRLSPAIARQLAGLYLRAGRADEAALLLGVGRSADADRVRDWAATCPNVALTTLRVMGRFELAARLHEARVRMLLPEIRECQHRMAVALTLANGPEAVHASAALVSSVRALANWRCRVGRTWLEAGRTADAVRELERVVALGLDSAHGVIARTLLERIGRAADQLPVDR